MYKVIIIDDNRLLADSLAKLSIWEEFNCKIECVCYDSSSGESAILRIKPDIVLTDIKLPNKDGLEVISEIIKTLPSVKVLCMSAYDDFSYSRRALKLKCVDYLLKPFSPEDLRNALSDLMEDFDEASDITDTDEESSGVLKQADNPILQPVIQYISENVDRSVTAEEVAKEFYISTSKLNKMIQQSYNMGFRELRMELCMNKAKELLLNIKYGVEEVALKVGYTNYFSFYRAFIREYGMTPTDYRNMQIKTDDGAREN